MSELSAIEASQQPVTVDSLIRDFRLLGLGAGDTVLVHSSVSSLGWVCGGAVAVVTALLSVLGRDGTLVVPTHSGALSDPADWANPPVPEAWWDTIRETMPAFEAATTPCVGMGVVPEVVRSWPSSLRSNHPQVSFTALGRAAAEVTSGHELATSLGEGSPLARLYQLGARVLLLGVGYDRNTSFHLAEYRSGVRKQIKNSGPVLVDGRRRWVSWDDIEVDSTDFPAIGTDLERTGVVRLGQVGSATARLMSQPAAVDFAVNWLMSRASRVERGLG